MLEIRSHIVRKMLVEEREKLFVFGDNVERRGLGGQAKEMRGEPNAVGIITKHTPTMDQGAFLRDAFYDEWMHLSALDICKLLLSGRVVVWPKAGIGTGRAHLPAMAPKIYNTILLVREKLEEEGIVV